MTAAAEIQGPNVVDLAPFRSQIEAALSYAGHTHQYEDVAAMVAAGSAQAFPGPASVIITETIDFPRQRVLNVFLAGGSLPELRAMLPLVLDWGRSIGCTAARFGGRRGWLRTFAVDAGFRDTGLIVMEASL